MRLARILTIGALGIGMAGASAVVSAQEGAANESAFVSISDVVKEIRAARTSSEAVKAYATGVGQIGENSSVKYAFVSQMVELGTPDTAEEQARDLTQLTSDGLSWAVLAFASGRRKEMDPALK